MSVASTCDTPLSVRTVGILYGTATIKASRKADGLCDIDLEIADRISLELFLEGLLVRPLAIG
jgi:hypothetical protein